MFSGGDSSHEPGRHAAHEREAGGSGEQLPHGAAAQTRRCHHPGQPPQAAEPHVVQGGGSQVTATYPSRVNRSLGAVYSCSSNVMSPSYGTTPSSLRASRRPGQGQPGDDELLKTAATCPATLSTVVTGTRQRHHLHEPPLLA